MAPPAGVWVLVFYEGEKDAIGEVSEIKPILDDDNVNDLKKRVIKEFDHELHRISSSRIRVYASGTTVPIPENTSSLMPLDPGDQVPAGTTSRTPLIVIAPKPEQQNGKLRCCSRIHYGIQLLRY
jgi:hypothetical protein